MLLSPVNLSDFAQLSQIAGQFFTTVAPAGWQQPTEYGGKGWTLHQTLAHLVAVAGLYQQAIECAIYHQPFVHPGLNQRHDLPKVNQQDIAERLSIAPAGLLDYLLATLDRTATLATTFSPDDWEKLIDVPAYNRPISVKALVGAQLAHLGFIHATQIARPIQAKPLWNQYSPEMMQRMIGHFFETLSYTYWPERGQGLQAIVNFVAAGRNGGQWFIAINPAGGHSGSGKMAKASLTLWFPSTTTLGQVFTSELSPWKATLTGRLVPWGNITLALRLPALFDPT